MTVSSVQRPAGSPATPALAINVARRSAWGGSSGRLRNQSWKEGMGMEYL
jgi:hypothetical protein